ncbi:hypothetical protein FQR65_LT20976 [Abscondita terminalis]|nr:hypothetical protein FQR65_LT20976 [Abscondita terminalis]
MGGPQVDSKADQFGRRDWWHRSGPLVCGPAPRSPRPRPPRRLPPQTQTRLQRQTAAGQRRHATSKASGHGPATPASQGHRDIRTGPTAPCAQPIDADARPGHGFRTPPPMPAGSRHRSALILPVLLAMFFALSATHHPRPCAACGSPVSCASGPGCWPVGWQPRPHSACNWPGPAAEWMQKPPGRLRQLGKQLRSLARPVHEANQRRGEHRACAGGGDARFVSSQCAPGRRSVRDAGRAPSAAAWLAVVLLTFSFHGVPGGKPAATQCASPCLPTRQAQNFTVPASAVDSNARSRATYSHHRHQVLVGLVFATIPASGPSKVESRCAAVGHAGRVPQLRGPTWAR